MRWLRRAALLCAAVAALPGCTPAPLLKADVDGRIVCDADAMAKAEQAMRRNVGQIQWVNCPRAVLRAD
jgi:hypothetical protein